MRRQWHRLQQWARTVFRRRAVERELDDELRDWIEVLTERHRANGLTPAAARRAALVEIGGVEPVKEEALSLRNGSQLDSTMSDARYAWRSLRRAPGFTLAAVLTFALGIGANTAIFSVVKAVLIEPLPYRDADRLMLVWADLTHLGYPHAPLAGPELVEFQEGATAFERMGGVWATNATLTGDGEPEQLRLATVTPEFFATLGVEALHGRVIGPQDFGQPVQPLLLSHALWQRRFGGDLAIVGKRTALNDRPAVVVGVMAADFTLLFPPDAALPADLQAWAPGSAQLRAQPRGQVGSSRVDLQACKLEYSIVSPK